MSDPYERNTLEYDLWSTGYFTDEKVLKMAKDIREACRQVNFAGWPISERDYCIMIIQTWNQFLPKDILNSAEKICERLIGVNSND